MALAPVKTPTQATPNQDAALAVAAVTAASSAVAQAASNPIAAAGQAEAAVVAAAAVASKPVWQSKTFYVGVITAVVPFVCPPVAIFIKANPELVSGAVGLVFTALRFISHGKVTLT